MKIENVLPGMMIDLQPVLERFGVEVPAHLEHELYEVEEVENAYGAVTLYSTEGGNWAFPEGTEV